MSQLVKIESHVSDALNRLISQYREKPNFRKIITKLTERHQALENCFFQMSERLDIQNSEGVQLDNFGGLVGQAREGNDDDIYKVLLRTKIGINISKSIPENLIDIVKQLTTRPLREHIIERTRADILDSRAGAVFRHMPGAKNIVIRVLNDDFLNDLTTEDTINGFQILNNTAVTLGGFDYRNISATDLPDFPFIGASFEFTFSIPMRVPLIKYRNLGNFQFFLSTDGEALTQIDYILRAISQVSPAGSRVDYLSVYLPGPKSFSFAGNDDGGGFNEGELATLYTIPGDFEFNGGDGFGSLNDPLAGGKFIA